MASRSDSAEVASSRRQQLAALNAERVVLEDRLRATSQSLASVMRKIAQLSPAYTLPDDVWFDIIDLAYAHRFPECHTEHYSMDDFPITFSHVSQRFRRLALTMPKLWSCIHITLPQLSRDIYGMVATQLMLSDDAPLNILLSFHETAQSSYARDRLDWNNDNNVETSDQYRRFRESWQLIRLHSHRWKRLAIYLRPRQLAFDLCESVIFSGQLYMPLLEHLETYVHDGNAIPAEPTTLNSALVGAPQLRILRITGFTILGAGTGLPNLTELFLANLGPAIGCGELLGFIAPIAANLRTLTLSKLRLAGQPYLVKLPQLRQLSLCDILHGESVAAVLLQGAPRLLRLELLGHVVDVEALFAELTKCAPPTIEIVLLWGLCNDRGHNLGRYIPIHRPYFDIFSGLKHLLLMDYNASMQLEDLLQRSLIAESPYLPGLQQLTIEPESSISGLVWSQAVVDNLYKFVKHRSDIGYRLKQLYLAGECDPQFRAEVFSTLRQYVDVVEESAMTSYRASIRRWNAVSSVPYIPQWKNMLEG